ncbi:MAG TPA: chemotaxis protein CheW [Bacteriovoracaceae bacterium]|nr:chemotaxis protein CheW [Bacteriovoracaceae bacterium]
MSSTEQLTTFYVGPILFGVEVSKVQEVTGSTHITPVPRAPEFIKGLINLRGQIATAVDLNELFKNLSEKNEDHMTVVCQLEGSLVSLIVDSIGDVVEVEKTLFETTPEILPPGVRKYIKGIYKMKDQLMSVLDIEKIFEELSPEGK